MVIGGRGWSRREGGGHRREGLQRILQGHLLLHLDQQRRCLLPAGLPPGTNRRGVRALATGTGCVAQQNKRQLLSAPVLRCCTAARRGAGYRVSIFVAISCAFVTWMPATT